MMGEKTRPALSAREHARVTGDYYVSTATELRSDTSKVVTPEQQPVVGNTE